ncbi:MAG: PAS domain S-box protein, partial [Desulfobacula sp.]
TTHALKRMLSGETIQSLETKRYTKYGKLLDIQLSCATYTDDRGETIGSTVIYRDVTEKKKIEARLLESEEKYRSAMEAVADPIIVYDNEGRVVYFNPAFSRVFKWSLPERINRKMDDFVPEKNWPETKKMIDMVIAGEFFSGIETARYDKHRNIIPVCISGSTYNDKENKMAGSVISLQDITERKKAEEALKQKEKLKGVLEMAGAVCHELSQPAMIIAGYAEIFLMNIDKSSPLFKKTDKIREQVQRIGELTQKLMNITKYETREYSKGKTIVDIDKASAEIDRS